MHPHLEVPENQFRSNQYTLETRPTRRHEDLYVKPHEVRPRPARKQEPPCKEQKTASFWRTAWSIIQEYLLKAGSGAGALCSVLGVGALVTQAPSGRCASLPRSGAPRTNHVEPQAAANTSETTQGLLGSGVAATDLRQEPRLPTPAASWCAATDLQLTSLRLIRFLKTLETSLGHC